MNKHDNSISQGLERQLAKAIERVTDNITRNHKLRREIVKLRRQGRQPLPVPDEVREWFEETDQEIDE